jgi:hypothetical protein
MLRTTFLIVFLTLREFTALAKSVSTGADSASVLETPTAAFSQKSTSAPSRLFLADLSRFSR